MSENLFVIRGVKMHLDPFGENPGGHDVDGKVVEVPEGTKEMHVPIYVEGGFFCLPLFPNGKLEFTETGEVAEVIAPRARPSIKFRA